MKTWNWGKDVYEVVAETESVITVMHPTRGEYYLTRHETQHSYWAFTRKDTRIKYPTWLLRTGDTFKVAFEFEG